MSTRAKALTHLKKVDKRLYKAAQGHFDSLPVALVARPKAKLFESLCRTIAGQQLTGKAADTIYTRVKAACGGRVTPQSVKRVSPAKLRAAGLSGAKTKTLKALASAVASKQIELGKLSDLPEEEAKSRLTEIWGIGPWSAEMFLMFSLGRPDVFSPGDLGLARSIEAIYKLPKNSPREKLSTIASRWSPHRTYAALILWRIRDAK